jgi:hypothetical protein
VGKATALKKTKRWYPLITTNRLDFLFSIINKPIKFFKKRYPKHSFQYVNNKNADYKKLPL